MALKFRSTKSPKFEFSAEEALLFGLAPDGGLFVPVAWPDVVPSEFFSNGFADFACRLLESFFAEPIRMELPNICRRAFDFPVPLRLIRENVRVLELFHGPTCAFKDFGARFLAACLAHLNPAASARPRAVLVATSGDTGGAVGAAFSSLTKIPVVILFPKGRISRAQEIQLSVWGEGVHALAVEGTFDDCQRLVKAAFRDWELAREIELLSANSINIGRLLPQTVYFALASLLHARETGLRARFIVPSGNLGNGTAALWARRLGFPIDQVVFAHNANHTFPDYVSTGEWHPHVSVDTLANAMDVGDPSNFARIQDLFPDVATLRAQVEAVSIDDDTIRSVIREEFFGSGEIWCPHTATAFAAAKKLGHGPWIVAATAHAAKFADVIRPTVGRDPEAPPQLDRILRLEPRSESMRGDSECLAEKLRHILL